MFFIMIKQYLNETRNLTYFNSLTRREILLLILLSLFFFSFSYNINNIIFSFRMPQNVMCA